MPLTEKGALIDTNEQPTCAAHERFANALFKKVYGDDDLVRLSAQAANPEIRKAYLRMLARKNCEKKPHLCKNCEERKNFAIQFRFFANFAKLFF